MILRVTALLLSSALVLSACDGDSRPFSEAVEVRTLNLTGVQVLKPADVLDDIYLNINQGLQLGVEGLPGIGAPIALSANKRTWSVSDPSIASISENGYLQALADGPVQVFVSVGELDSVGFDLTVSDATLSTINPIVGLTTIERCIPQKYSATGTFSDGTDRNLDNLTWALSSPANARFFEKSGTSTQLNALAAQDQLTLMVTASGGQVLNQPLVVLDTLKSIAILPSPLILNVGDEPQLMANGFYTINTGETTETLRRENITNAVDWRIVTGTNNLSVSNARGSKGLLNALAAGKAEVIAACGALTDRDPVDIRASDALTTIGVRIGSRHVLENRITLSLSANVGAIPIRASLGTEYDSDNDVTSTIDFQITSSDLNEEPRFVLFGNRTSNPTITLRATGIATIVARESTDSEAVETITITVEP